MASAFPYFLADSESCPGLNNNIPVKIYFSYFLFKMKADSFFPGSLFQTILNFLSRLITLYKD